MTEEEYSYQKAEYQDELAHKNKLILYALGYDASPAFREKYLTELQSIKIIARKRYLKLEESNVHNEKH